MSETRLTLPGDRRSEIEEDCDSFEIMIRLLVQEYGRCVPDMDWKWLRSGLEDELTPFLSDSGRSRLFEILNQGEVSVLAKGIE